MLISKGLDLRISRDSLEIPRQSRGMRVSRLHFSDRLVRWGFWAWPMRLRMMEARSSARPMLDSDRWVCHLDRFRRRESASWIRLKNEVIDGSGWFLMEGWKEA